MSIEETRRQIAQAQFERQMRNRPLWDAIFERQRKYREMQQDAIRARYAETKEE